ncbi:MAG TPA: histone deacetylase [Phycisphaerae bacterium]|nr:histone deacetylase [Phycisphaerae bacterium]HOJ72434.1 histone deacetylase [Phycisphaerae bacterium]HOM49904.1 histone deacetylase [Phycisphaerae bacterium]HON66188.1 histone deacetylase [Phycisphaerae bacterium]HOQ87531.1 histone deacetylase [Phycisphaerae bacterium]
MTQTGLVWSEHYLEHDPGPHYPERPDRLSAIKPRLERAGIFASTTPVEATIADLALIERVHSPAYIERFRTRCERGLPYVDTVECPLCPATFETARRAVGGVIAACDAVMAGRCESVFCAVRPPGHHAEVDKAYGFCYFNNIAIAAEYLRHEHGLRRMAILDWDVHHGNGTQHHFEADPDIFFVSIHQHPRTLFPGTGFEDERGIDAGLNATLNCPMMPGCIDEHYHHVFEEQILPRIAEFRPEFLLISAGFDAHVDDPLAHIDLSTDAFEWMTVQSVRLMRELGHPRIVSVLEGGYNLDALADCVLAHLQGLRLP